MQHILIVEDIEDTRQWLEQIARTAFSDCTLCSVSQVRSALAQIASQHFDIALVDLGLPDGSGLDVLHQLKKNQPHTIAIVTSINGDDASIISALAAGASGYLLKESAEQVLIHQLQLLAEGIPPLSPAVARRLMNHFRLTGPLAAEQQSALSQREREVLFLISRGLCNREVAETLKLSESTIGSYIKTIYRKLGINSRAEASWCATRLGLGLD